MSQPFSFYEDDLRRAREKAIGSNEVDDRILYQFRAKDVPYRIRVPLFQMMMERDEHERE